MSSAMATMKAFLSEGLLQAGRIVATVESHSTTISSTVRPVLLWLIVRIFVLGVAGSLFHPILRRVSRAPLLRYLGMKYGDMKLSPLKLKLTITDVELTASRSGILRSIVLAIFPSANVTKAANIADHPETRLAVRKLSVRIRVSSAPAAAVAGGLGAATDDGLCDDIASESTVGDDDDDDDRDGSSPRDDTAIAIVATRYTRPLVALCGRLLPRLVVVVRICDATVEIDKAYLAPEPPPEYRGSSSSSSSSLPAAVPRQEGVIVEDLPAFCQEPVLEGIRNEEAVDAEKVTLFVERWIDHVVTKMRRKGDASADPTKVEGDPLDSDASSEGGSTRNDDAAVDGEGKDEQPPSPLPAPPSCAEERRTHDERVNYWIRRVGSAILRSLSFELRRSSIVIAGAGARDARVERERGSSPRETSLAFARIPRSRRALTVVGADVISLTFSEGRGADMLFRFEGVYLKVGYPLEGGEDDENNGHYAWRVLAHPFRLDLGIQGVLPFVVWATSYDHRWRTRALGATLSAAEVAVNLSPDHLHTVLLHLDDYTDAASSFNEWFAWMKGEHRKTLVTSEEERAEYRDNYARLKGGKTDEAGRMTSTQMKELEKRMTRFEITSLRCHAMRDEWRIPKANGDLQDYLRRSRSSICGSEDCHGAATPEDAETQFQRRFATPLHALVGLIREETSLLTPRVTIKSRARTLHLDFPGAGDASAPSVPSSIAVSGASFDIVQKNPLSIDDGGEREDNAPRPFLDLSLRIRACEWGVVDDAAFDAELPLFRDRTPVGVVYMSEEAASSSSHVLSLGFTIAVTPTFEPDQHLGLTLKTSNLVIVVNSFPLLSAMQNLIELSDIPFRSPEETMSDPDEGKEDELASDASVTPFAIRAKVTVIVENTQLLFLVDRKKLPRGILSLQVYGIDIGYESGESKGELSLSTQPVSLCAGQIAHDQSSGNGQIDLRLMPFIPIMDVEGATVGVIAEEDRASGPESTVTLKMKIDLGARSLLVNASPSTIVALLGVMSSLDPFLEWAAGEQKAREEEQKRLEDKRKEEQAQHMKIQYEVLCQIFKDIDVDGSGELSEDELELVVLKLFDESNISERNEKNEVNRANEPTSYELKRERDLLLSLMDQNRTNEISFQELDDAFFRLANKIDDVNLEPALSADEVSDNHVGYKNSYAHCDSFLSAATMKKLIYFDNMREYSSLSEVFRITGQEKLEMSKFAAPSLWRKGEGIDLFWDLYTRETGCTRDSLNGQNMALVQRKLVRSLCNYEFAKYCWKTLVQPGLYDIGIVHTHWLLDKDSMPRIQCGVVDLLLKHVETEVIKGINRRKRTGGDILFDVSIVADLDSATVRFGSSHTFTNPLFEARVFQVNTNATGLLSSQTGWFVPEKELAKLDDDDNIEIQKRNQIGFRSSMSAFYLNTKHNHMECFVEPYNSFGTATYTLFPEDSSDHRGGDDTGDASFSIHINCPRFLSMNTSRSFFETASVLTKVISHSDPETFRTMIFDRDVSYIRNFWYAKDQTKSGLLHRHEIVEMLHSMAEVHWTTEIAGLNDKEKNQFVAAFCSLADNNEEDGMISLDDLISAFKTYTSRCYFSGSEEILLKNNIGRELKCCTKDHLDEHCQRYSISSEYDYQRLLRTFLRLDDGNACAIPLSGNLAFVTSGYKLIDDISVSPYQTMMFPLKRRKKGSQKKRKHSNASGFSPHLTVVPESDSLDSITLDVRTSVHINTEIPINLRIVRIGKSAGKFRKHGTKRKLDLGKKNLIAALRNCVEGAPIVYEKSDIAQNTAAPLPLDVIDSSHFHVLLLQPLTGHNGNGNWRDPILLTKDFLFNPTNIREVTRCHALSGIVVQKERLNVHLSEKHRDTPVASDTKRSILRRTAWDTTIKVVPFFRLTNSLPFPIAVRTWQISTQEENELWDEQLLPSASGDSMNDNSSSDEDFSFVTPNIKFRRTSPDDIHFSQTVNHDHYSQDTVTIGQTLRLSGVSLRETLFIQVSQHVHTSEDASFMWTNPMQIDLKKMRTGISKKGLTQLPQVILDLGDNCDCLVHVSIGGSTKVPECTIYSPYWIMNKTGLKLEYMVAGQNKSYLDSGFGGLPIMLHGSKSEHTNEKYQNVSRKISVIPLERPSLAVAQNWWDDTSNGSLVLRKGTLEEKGQNLVDWSEDFELDAAGTNGVINCGRVVINVKNDSLAGAFHRTNLITFSPRYVVKNILHIAISIFPIFGGVHDAIRKAYQLRQNMKESDLKRKLDLAPGQSTVLFNFHSFSSGVEKPYHWIAFCVNASRYGASFKCKWHLIPADVIQSHHFGEHDGSSDTMCAILEAQVHSSDTGSTLVSIKHAEVPPYRIENRSNTHYLRLIQNDSEAVVFELPPMYSCAYTWDSPLGKKKLRAVVIPKSKSKENQLDEALALERYEETSQANGVDSDTDTDDETIESETTKDPLMHSLSKGVRIDSLARKLNKTERYRSPRKRAVFSIGSRSYAMKSVGKQDDLPCPSAKENESGLSTKSSKLFSHIRIVAGTKILSFSDSSWLSDQVQAGILRKGGNFKSALCQINLQGFGLYIMDDFPKEVMAVVVKDVLLQKPTGSIELTARVRHFQVDAMLPNARYPIIIEPMPLGVDRRDDAMKDKGSRDLILPEGVEKNDCFWRQNEEKPLPVFEVACSYVPQSNMTWIPNLNIYISPLKLHIDVDYILRILGMVFSSIYKFQDDSARNLIATSHANDQLKYITRGELNICMTYVEKLYIAPVYFDMELNIKSDDPDDDGGGDSSLTLHSIAQTTSSAGLAGLLSWVINVGANFAHVSPTFRYSQETYTDEYCDIFELLVEIAKSYVVQSIKQGYKVIFSMQLLGDPSLLLRGYKTGVHDLFATTGAELAAGGKDGVGKGVTSFLQNIVGGTAFTLGKISGGIADVADAVVTTETTSNHLKPKSASSDGAHPDNVVDGVVEGTKFLGQTVAHGFAGLIGNPYRGAKTGTATGVAKGVVSGVAGLAVSPFVGALGFIAKTSDGIGATTKHLDLGVIESRCRPARMVPWGRPMCDNGLAYLKGIGIRVHTVRYQKVRKRINKKDSNEDDEDDDDVGHVTSKEYKRSRAAEERRKNPPRKLVSIKHMNDKHHIITCPVRPKLLEDAPGNLVLSHYAVTFEETLILRSTDLQLGDAVAINIWNYRGLKSATTRATPLGVCKISVGDIYSSLLLFAEEQLKRRESHLSAENATADSLIIPVPHECALFKPCKKKSPDNREIFDVIGEELAAIAKSEEDNFVLFDSDSSESDSDSSFLGDEAKKRKKEEPISNIVKGNERLFGSVSVSFFPIPW